MNTKMFGWLMLAALVGVAMTASAQGTSASARYESHDVSIQAEAYAEHPAFYDEPIRLPGFLLTADAYVKHARPGETVTFQIEAYAHREVTLDLSLHGIWGAHAVGLGDAMLEVEAGATATTEVTVEVSEGLEAHHPAIVLVTAQARGSFERHAVFVSVIVPYEIPDYPCACWTYEPEEPEERPPTAVPVPDRPTILPIYDEPAKPDEPTKPAEPTEPTDPEEPQKPGETERPFPERPQLPPMPTPTLPSLEHSEEAHIGLGAATDAGSASAEIGVRGENGSFTLESAAEAGLGGIVRLAAVFSAAF